MLKLVSNLRKLVLKVCRIILLRVFYDLNVGGGMHGNLTRNGENGIFLKKDLKLNLAPLFHGLSDHHRPGMHAQRRIDGFDVRVHRVFFYGQFFANIRG